MKRSIGRFSLIVFLACGLVSLSLAQGRQTGSISGVILDTQANPLPGASVILIGIRLLGQRTYITTDTGKFRFPALSPGPGYEIRVEMPGFKTLIRQRIIVSVGKTTYIRFELEMAEIKEEIYVTADSPVVDIETSKISINYSAEFLASIPMNRDLYDIQNSIPGAISDGADYRRTSSILGGTVRSSLYTLDGVPMNDPATWYSMANINVDVYEEIEFGIGALPAEVGQADSAYINIVTKSGGNKLSGGFTTYYTGEKFAEVLTSEEDIEAMDVSKPELNSDYKDFSVNLGGPILLNHAWFFMSGRRMTWGKVNQYTPEKRMETLGFSEDIIQHFDLEHQEWLGFAKLTFQLTPNIRYMGMLHYNHIYEPYYTNGVDDDIANEAVPVYNHENTYTTTHQLNLILNQNTYLDIRGNYIHRYFPLNYQPGTEANYRSYDDEEDIVWGRDEYEDEYIRKKMIASASITTFQDNLAGPSHEIKVGVEFEQSEYHRDWYSNNPWYTYWEDYAANNPYYSSTKYRKGRLRIRLCPPEKGMWDVQDHTRRLSAYVQDSLKAGRLAVNMGVRFDYSYQYEPEQFRPELQYDMGPELQNPALGPNDLLEALIAQMKAEGLDSPFDELTTPYRRAVTFKTLSPRIGLVYDLFGDGKTALKASFARYYEPVWAAKYNANQIFGARTYQWTWTDNNANKLMDLPGIDTYLLDWTYSQDPNEQFYDEYLKSPYMHEFIGGIERELSKDFLVGMQFVWKENKNIVESIDKFNGYDFTATDEKGLIWIPYDVVDPGWDGEFGTSDDQNITVYGLRADRPAKEEMGTNPPELKRKYWAAILTLDKRMSHRWQLKGSVLYSSFKGNTSAGYSATEGESNIWDDPNSLINAYGPLYFDRPLQIKLMGSVVLPHDFVVSAYFVYRSGSAWERSLRVYIPSNLDVRGPGYVAIYAESRGSRRQAPYSNLDIRLEKDFLFGNIGKLSLYLDIFNLAGRTGVDVYENPNGRLRYYTTPPSYEFYSQYGKVISIYGVRSLRFGLRLGF